MSDIKVVTQDGRGPRGERGERGERGKSGPTGPTGATGATGPGSTPPVIAAASVSAAGAFLAQTGFASIAHLGAGAYALTLADPPGSPNDVVAAITPSNGVGVTGFAVALPIIDVFTNANGGAPTDMAFTIVVYSLA